MLNLYFATNFSCNLRCKYCYVPEYNKNGNAQADQLAIQAAELFVEKCRRENVQLGRVSLHGAEPGLLSPEAAAAVANQFARYTKYAFPVGIQSNGTLFNNDYFDRFECCADEDLEFRLGISIDGPQAITDGVRGKGVFKRASRGLETANRRGYKTQILCVVGSHTIKDMPAFEAWVDGLVEERQDIRFKPAYGAYQLNADEQAMLAKWLNKTGYARFYQEINKNICVTQGNQCAWLEVDVNGGCYSCNKSFGDAGVFASWKTESLSAILEKRRKLFHEFYESPQCASCEIKSICNSGCPMDRTQEGVAVDCSLKRTLLSIAAKDTGVPWQEIVNAASKFQRSSPGRKIFSICRVEAG